MEISFVQIVLYGCGSAAVRVREKLAVSDWGYGSEWSKRAGAAHDSGFPQRVIGMTAFRYNTDMTSTLAETTLDQLSIDTLRLLAVDAVQKANSGHPGAPLGCAPMAYLLFHKLMKHNPAHAKWADRDRFVLSNGHASALLYGTLFLSGYDVTLDDLKSFRQWGSRTPGHPERGRYGWRGSDDRAAGPGLAMAVGMAMAEKHLAAVYNRPGLRWWIIILMCCWATAI